MHLKIDRVAVSFIYLNSNLSGKCLFLKNID